MAAFPLGRFCTLHKRHEVYLSIASIAGNLCYEERDLCGRSICESEEYISNHPEGSASMVATEKNVDTLEASAT
jgi:hypothetical protein